MSVIVPHQEIPKDSLHNLISAYVLRDGTDYGEQEVPLEVKIQQVLQALQAGQAVILYSELDESFDIVASDAVARVASSSDD